VDSLTSGTLSKAGLAAQTFLDTGYWHYKQTEEQVFARLKGEWTISAV
jgi:hypothetical protein